MNGEETQPMPAQIEEEGQPTPQGYPSAGLPPAEVGAAAADFLKWALESEACLETLGHDLKGEVPIEVGDTTVYKEVEGRRVMNNKGVNSMIITMKPFLGKEYTTSDIKEEEAHMITKEAIHVLIDAIYCNYWEWEINGSLYRWLIKHMDSQIYMALTRVKNGGIKKLVKPVYRRVETFGQAPKSKKGGILSGFFGR